MFFSVVALVIIAGYLIHAAVATQAAPGRQAVPPGLKRVGALLVGCQLRHNDSGQPDAAVVTFYNGSAGQLVQLNRYGIDWGSNGVLLSENAFSAGASIPPGQDYTETVTGPPLSATPCLVAGWP